MDVANIISKCHLLDDQLLSNTCRRVLSSRQIVNLPSLVMFESPSARFFWIKFVFAWSSRLSLSLSRSLLCLSCFCQFTTINSDQSLSIFTAFTHSSSLWLTINFHSYSFVSFHTHASFFPFKQEEQVSAQFIVVRFTFHYHTHLFNSILFVFFCFCFCEFFHLWSYTICITKKQFFCN